MFVCIYLKCILCSHCFTLCKIIWQENQIIIIFYNFKCQLTLNKTKLRIDEYHTKCKFNLHFQMNFV